jgi:hypothetical protein
MRPGSTFLLAACLFVGMASMAMSDNLFENADFKEGFQGWHGDGHAVFLKPDGTEGDETDPGVIPVIKIALAKGQPHSVYQTIRSKDIAGMAHVSVEVFASIDFKRSTHADDYAVQDEFNMTVTDFEIRFNQPDTWTEQDSELKRGKWTTVHATWGAMQATEERAVYFIIPPGDGYVYIKNPSMTQ